MRLPGSSCKYLEAPVGFVEECALLLKAFLVGGKDVYKEKIISSKSETCSVQLKTAAI